MNYLKSHKILAIILLIAVIFIVGELFSTQVHSALNAADLIPKPEHFTELYLDSFNDLPKSIAPGQTVKFTFEIHNLEGIDKMYPYMVYFETSSGEKQIVASGTILVYNGDTYAVSKSYQFETSALAGVMTIELPSVNEDLHFALPSDR